jgi:hypothetical protein
MVKQHRSLRKCAALAAGIALGLVSVSASAAEIQQVGYSSLSGTQFVSVPSGGLAPGTNYNGIVVIDGLAFGEHFAGQTVTANGNFDVIGGTPTAGLTLQPGTPGHNIDIFDHTLAGTIINGVGPLGFPADDAIGEGALSILFGSDQSEFGFRLAGGNLGNAYVSFFRDDGSLIDSLTLSSLPFGVSFYGFARDGGVHDIRGVSIWNDDFTGFGLSNFRFDVASVPEPSTWAMMLLGFAAIGTVARRRNAQAVARRVSA